MNSVLMIQPYKLGSVWVFDDASVGLRQEPFVGEINDMIDRMVVEAGVRSAHRGFVALFSDKPIKGYHMALSYVGGTAQRGTTYVCPRYGLEGWLCPALSHYFGRSPARIYVRAESLKLTLWERICRLIKR